MRSLTLTLTACLTPLVASAAGDFPVASCKSWNGTVVERSGINTVSAAMKGIITKADLQEYCERDPGGETKAYGGKLTTRQCVERHLRAQGQFTLSAEANCRTGTVVFRYGPNSKRAKFPLGSEDADASCASGLSPLVEQFKMLCPAEARRLGVE